MKVLSGSSTTKIAPNTTAMIAGSINWHASGESLRRRDCRGHHGLDRQAQCARRGGHVLELRLHVEHHPVEPGHLDGDHVPIDLDGRHLTVELVLVDGLLADPDRGGAVSYTHLTLPTIY